MVIVSKERVKKLENVLVKYPDIISDDEIEDSIVKTFTFEKPLTSIELYEKIVKFIEELEDFFFVGHVHLLFLKIVVLHYY